MIRRRQRPSEVSEQGLLREYFGEEDWVTRDAHIDDAAADVSFEIVPPVDAVDDDRYLRERERARERRRAERGRRQRYASELQPTAVEGEERTSGKTATYTFGVVVLTQGKRSDDLRRGFASLLAQKGVELDIVCVGNGWEPSGLPPEVKTVALPQNVGIPAGRNEGVPHVKGEFLFFLDDDAWLPDDTALLKMAQLMRAKPRIGLVQPRVMDPERDDAPRRWIPRLKKGEASQSSNVFSVWEGAVCLQRRAYDACGGWPAPFWYAHEGIELAWRIWDAGFQVWYMGDLAVAHPVIDPKRHEEYFFMNARNRVWLARRNLPFPLSWAYVGSWTIVQMLRWGTKPDHLRPWLQGWRAGWRDNPWAVGEPQRKLSGRGLLAMSLNGRPPVI